MESKMDCLMKFKEKKILIHSCYYLFATTCKVLLIFFLLFLGKERRGKSNIVLWSGIHVWTIDEARKRIQLCGKDFWICGYPQRFLQKGFSVFSRFLMLLTQPFINQVLEITKYSSFYGLPKLGSDRTACTGCTE